MAVTATPLGSKSVDAPVESSPAQEVAVNDASPLESSSAVDSTQEAVVSSPLEEPAAVGTSQTETDVSANKWADTTSIHWPDKMICNFDCFFFISVSRKKPTLLLVKVAKI